jgi:phytoene/squalene synthetase
LSRLVLESGNMTTETNPVAHAAAQLVGVAHGLTNSLRNSIPVLSTTGRLVVPAELTARYGVRSPRYLLSALGQGDAACVRAMQSAVRDVVDAARDHLRRARDLREQVLREPSGTKAASVLLPGLASEAFLNRLTAADYQLTDRNLRNVGTAEHAVCAARMVLAYYRKRY